MVAAKQKAKTVAGGKRASVGFPAAKRKKADDKDAVANNRKQSDSRSVSFNRVPVEFGDEREGAGFGEETQHFFERSSSEEHQGSDHEAEGQEDRQLRMRADIFLEEPQYAGAQSNRKAAFEEEDTTDAEQSGEDAAVNWSREQVWDSEENFDEEQHSIQDVQYEALDEEMEALDREYKELQAQEEEMLHGLKGRSDEEVQKGRAVSCQKALWDKALEVRILLQKPFSSANRLPLGDIKSFMCESNIEVENAFAKLTASSIETLGCLTETLKALSEQNSSFNEVSDTNDSNIHQESGGSPTLNPADDGDTVWQQLSVLYSRFVPFRNSSVDRWQRKTQLSSGAAASKSKLRAFNQSIPQQIETHMRDFSRVVQRMWLNRLSVDVIGMPAEQDQNPTSSTGNASNLQENNKEFNGDPELIDDTEFYQELLREFLESSDPAAIGTLYAVRKLQNKKRKVVDRRASKGRKIRYNVHDKIVNFMAPIPMSMPPVAEKLFSNIFGQGSSKADSVI